jgi:hypothetical protein
VGQINDCNTLPAFVTTVRPYFLDAFASKISGCLLRHVCLSVSQAACKNIGRTESILMGPNVEDFI